ncbi:hypothetical protein ACQQ2N_17355 [Dokdonella sp. MW10]|uniref:hypothetical protein n=1 Tax=Dokdonella sp. MW10 TaxID=2992926 RepID=UPI003F810E91
MQNGPIAHVSDRERLSDGTRYAVTVHFRGDFGMMVWAGRLDASAADSDSDAISPRDYVERQSVNFMTWADALEYFDRAPFRRLLEEIARTTTQLAKPADHRRTSTSKSNGAEPRL